MTDKDDDDTGWPPEERALLDSALDFYGAAEAVIEYGKEQQPRVRRDAPGLRAVRDAMGALERRIRAAHEAGVSPERIARITRLEDEIVELILRGRAMVPEPDPARAAE